MDDKATRTVFRFFTEVGIIHQLGRALIEARLPPDLTATHFGLVGHLSRRPEGETPLQLARAFQLPKTTMTHMLKVLQRHGLVEVVPNAADKRSKLVRATGKAAPFLDETMAALRPELEAVIAGVGLETVADALPGLEAIREKLDAARD